MKYVKNFVVKLIRENDKIVDVEVNGNPVKRGFIRGLKKAQNTSYWQEFNEGGWVDNPWGGGYQFDNGFEKSIALWCQRWYYNDYRYNSMSGKMQAPIQAYDDMKYFLLSLNSDAYYALLD